MTADNGDDALVRAAFDELKADEGHAHSTYASVLTRKPLPSASVLASPVLRLAAAAVVIVVAGATHRTVFVHEPKLIVPSDVVSLIAWRPETDVLLASPVQLLRAQARVRESMIDLDTLMTGVVR
jgi:hypothetical protein